MSITHRRNLVSYKSPDSLQNEQYQSMRLSEFTSVDTVLDITMDSGNILNMAVMQKIAEEIKKSCDAVLNSADHTTNTVVEDMKNLCSTIGYIRDNVSNISCMRVDGHHFDLCVASEPNDNSKHMICNVVLRVDLHSELYSRLNSNSVGDNVPADSTESSKDTPVRMKVFDFEENK